MPTVEKLLVDHGLAEFWQHPAAAADMNALEWRDRVYEAVEVASDKDRRNRMQSLSSTVTYQHMEEWGRNPHDYLLSPGE